MYWLNTSGEYYEGDKQSPADQPVTKRPSSLHVWSDGWVDGPEPVPQEVTRAQAKLALLEFGLLANAEAAAASAGEAFQIAFNDALTFSRTSPTLLAMAQALSLSDAQLDALFVAAGKKNP